MTTQTKTVHNTGTKAIKYTDSAGTMTPVYVNPGQWNDISWNDAGGNQLVTTIVEPSVVPQGGGGRPEE